MFHATASFSGVGFVMASRISFEAPGIVKSDMGAA